METQSRDSDIEIRVTLKDSEGNTLDVSEGKIGWEAKDSTGRVLSGHTGSDPLNCYCDGTALVITAPSNTFKGGYVYVRVMTITENENFDDGTKDVWGNWVKTDLKIV